MRIICLVLALAVTCKVSRAEVAHEYASTDERYKADIVVVVAHVDDEVPIGGYLARAVFDEHRRVAVIFTTRAQSGPSVVGNESGTEGARHGADGLV